MFFTKRNARRTVREIIEDAHGALANLANALSGSLPSPEVDPETIWAMGVSRLYKIPFAYNSPGIHPTNEKQSVSITGAPGGGTFILSYNGNPSNAINYNDDAAAVQAALDNIAELTGFTEVTGANPNFVVEFLDNSDAHVLLVLDTNSLTGGVSPNVAIAQTQAAANATGFPVYAPVVDDEILDGWLEIDTEWDKTAITANNTLNVPHGDIGTFSGVLTGILNATGNQSDMTGADDEDLGAGLLSGDQGGSSNSTLRGASAESGVRIIPAKVTAANPLRICVSGRGAGGSHAKAVLNGINCKSTQGAGFLFIEVTTPVQLAPPS